MLPARAPWPVVQPPITTSWRLEFLILVQALLRPGDVARIQALADHPFETALARGREQRGALARERLGHGPALRSQPEL